MSRTRCETDTCRFFARYEGPWGIGGIDPLILILRTTYRFNLIDRALCTHWMAVRVEYKPGLAIVRSRTSIHPLSFPWCDPSRCSMIISITMLVRRHEEKFFKLAVVLHHIRNQTFFGLHLYVLGAGSISVFR